MHLKEKYEKKVFLGMEDYMYRRGGNYLSKFFLPLILKVQATQKQNLVYNNFEE